jgi:hypothetical protein
LKIAQIRQEFRASMCLLTIVHLLLTLPFLEIKLKTANKGKTARYTQKRSLFNARCINFGVLGVAESGYENEMMNSVVKHCLLKVLDFIRTFFSAGARIERIMYHQGLIL